MLRQLKVFLSSIYCCYFGRFLSQPEGDALVVFKKPGESCARPHVGGCMGQRHRCGGIYTRRNSVLIA